MLNIRLLLFCWFSCFDNVLNKLLSEFRKKNRYNKQNNIGPSVRYFSLILLLGKSTMSLVKTFIELALQSNSNIQEKETCAILY